jgi:beta-phosphoglucomutase-like phosphatase (HAD superfamily)
MEQLRVSPAECVALEDSRHGLDSALRAGIRAVVVTVNGYTADQDLGDAPLVVDSFGEPGAPARCLGGVVAVAGEVGLDTLRALHATATG